MCQIQINNAIHVIITPTITPQKNIAIIKKFCFKTVGD